MLTSLKKIIRKKVQSFDSDKKQALKMNRIQEIWREVVYLEIGKQEAINSWPLFIKRKTLVIKVPSAVLAQELQLRAHKIILEINKKFNRELIQRLEFQIG